MVHMMDDSDELLDLVNERDQKIGTILRENIPKLMPGDGYVRAANVFLINTHGELWVPRRTATKKIAPNGLDFSAGEHVQAGETYVQAAVRGLLEELNIAVTPNLLEYVGTLSPIAAGVPYFETLFLYKTDETPHYNLNDFVSFEWLTPEAFLGKMLEGETGKKGLSRSLELLLSYNKKRSKEV